MTYLEDKVKEAKGRYKRSLAGASILAAISLASIGLKYKPMETITVLVGASAVGFGYVIGTREQKIRYNSLHKDDNVEIAYEITPSELPKSDEYKHPGPYELSDLSRLDIWSIKTTIGGKKFTLNTTWINDQSPSLSEIVDNPLNRSFEYGIDMELPKLKITEAQQGKAWSEDFELSGFMLSKTFGKVQVRKNE